MKFPVTTAPESTEPTQAPAEETKVEIQAAASPDIQSLIDAAVAKALAAMPAAPVAKTPVNTELLEMAKVMGREIAQSMANAQLAVEAVKQQTAHDKLMNENKKKLALEEKCHICRQVVGDGKGRGCGGPWKRDPKTNQFVMEPVLNPDGSEVMDADGKPMMRRIEDPNQFHTKMVVYPADPLAAEWFPYVKVNGVEYFSQGPNHEIYVPKVNDIASTLAIYTTNEIEQRVGRKHVRKFGGSVGPGNQNVAPVGTGFN